jgi:hypothetical protein
MKYAYSEMYLSDVQKNLGFFFQATLHNLNLSVDEVQGTFLASEIPTQIEFANPNFLCGKSGYELAILAFPQFEKKLLESIDEPFYPEAEYWSGHVLAYYQWYSNRPFAEILGKYPLERILSDYRLMHEADITKMALAMDAVVMAK